MCGERGALQEWRAALERSSDDITALEQFTKQDVSKAKVLQITVYPNFYYQIDYFATLE